MLSGWRETWYRDIGRWCAKLGHAHPKLYHAGKKIKFFFVYRWTYMSSTGLVHKCLSIYILLILNYLHYVFSAACQWWHQPSHNTEPFRSSHLQRWEKKWHRACWASERRPCWLFSQQKESSRGDYHNNNFEFIMKAAKTICNTVFLLS